MNSLGFLSDVKPFVNPPKFIGKIVQLKCPEDGFFTPNISSGSKISKGDLLGQLDGFEIIAPSNGIIIRMAREKFAFKGDTLANYVSDKN